MNHTEQGLRHGFRWSAELVSPDGEVLRSEELTPNLIPQAGVDYLAGLIRGTGTIIAPWYIGIGEGNYIPTSGVTSADLPSPVGECTAYSNATRPAWGETYDGVSLISNLSNRVEYAMTAEKRLYTGFLVSSSTKGGNTGLLLSVVRFSTPYDTPAGSVFRLGASITLLPSV